ncbi:MAG: hypothetical protein AAB295_08875 [Chloroflexota bacterium]
MTACGCTAAVWNQTRGAAAEDRITKRRLLASPTPRALRTFCTRVGSGEDRRSAFAGAFGVDIDTFHARFEAYRIACTRSVGRSRRSIRGGAPAGREEHPGSDRPRQDREGHRDHEAGTDKDARDEVEPRHARMVGTCGRLEKGQRSPVRTLGSARVPQGPKESEAGRTGRSGSCGPVPTRVQAAALTSQGGR